jgi:hypothetical protein
LPSLDSVYESWVFDVSDQVMLDLELGAVI